ncbi:MAG: proline--tRNA ligase [Gammaproteobacteria bacterium]|nr:proline--tRNA ligase [Gammaproteobacteria bacterium]
MRQSQLLIPTLRENPADADVVSHRLMLRAGLIRQLAAGLYTWLPLGLRVLRKVEAIIRDELNRSGAQEVLMPVVQPAELWQETGRWQKMGVEMMRMKDRHDRDFCMGPTHEEVITDLFRREIRSYKQLPVNFYQIQTKFRDERRPRFGVMRAREFTMKDGYSFHLDQASFDATYREMYDCYSRILRRMDLQFRAVEADTGNIGGENSHEFHVLAGSGEDVIAYSTEGTYGANLERAISAPPAPRPTAALALEKVSTPSVRTIDDVARFFSVDAGRTIKTLLVAGVDGPVAMVLRGDDELNEIKAAKLPGVRQPLTMADEASIRSAAGCSAGSIGPVGLSLPVYADREAAALADFICGANQDDWHLKGANWGRDAHLTEDRIVDIRNVREGDPAPDGKGTLRFLRGIEVGHIFQLDYAYSRPMNAAVLDADGKSVVTRMGCYGMGVTRLVAAIIEQNHDDAGLCWPLPVAPFDVHLVPLNYGRSEAVQAATDALYAELTAAGKEVLLDDRDERPGVKFADSDLIGIPHRIVIGDRALKEGQLEYKRRGDMDARSLPRAEVVALLG